MRISLNHFEIKVRDLPKMEEFYTSTLGFMVTDRTRPGGNQMVFLSCNASEHHQMVLAESENGDFSVGSLDHLAFRISDLQSLRDLHDAFKSYACLAIETVSHGTTWSIYFRDPEGNRIEFFVNTPWHVAQPLRFPIDLSRPDDGLIAWTEEKISSQADFQPAERWLHRHQKRMNPKAT